MLFDKSSQAILGFNPRTKKKKAFALVIGINYAKGQFGLNGCINDANNMSSALVSKGIPHNLLIDSKKYHILREINKAIRMSWDHKLEDFLFFYSGHGISFDDNGSDERDGYDECIVPFDFGISGYIFDDELYNLFTQFNPTTRVMCIFDCCNAGTLLDSKYRWMGSLMLNENPDKIQTNKIVCLSGCRDDQLSQEILSPKGYAGAMTYFLIPMLFTENNLFRLAKSLNKKIREIGILDQNIIITSSYDFRAEPYLFPSKNLLKMNVSRI
jgi:hypothetical protein